MSPKGIRTKVQNLDGKWDKKDLTERKDLQKITAEKSNNITGRNKSKDIAKEGSLKKYRDRVEQYKQNGTFQNRGINFNWQLVKSAQGQINNWMQKQQNNSGKKFGNRKAKWKNKMKKKRVWKNLKNIPRWTYTWNHWEQHSRKYLIVKRQAITAYMDSGKEIHVHRWQFRPGTE